MPKTLELAESQQIDKLRARIRRLMKINRDYLYEMAERGKALELLYSLCFGWESQLPGAFTEKVMKIFEEYIARCTPQCTRNEKQRNRKEDNHANNSVTKT